MNYKGMTNMGRLRSKLELEINQFRHDGDINGKNRKISIKELAGMVGIGESTLYLRWKKPETFQSDEIAKIANLLQLDINKAEQLAQEFEPDQVPTLTDVEYSSTREDRALSEEKSTEVTKETASSTYNKRSRIIAMLLMLLAMVISFGLYSSNYAPSSVNSSPSFSALYQGKAIDLNANEIGQALNLHSKLYIYELENLKTQTIGEDITMTGDIFWSHIKDEGEKHQQALFVASGKHVGDTVAIVYEITDDARSEMWIGTAVLHMPRSGPAKGYWLNLHNEQDPDAQGPYAIGKITLNR
ncbi:helix-turn-helix domain-containing protein [Photobacterium chitinilyticum]|uniref:XRE family transcriptional regulator n=1 Tax=Photobacterium chitinilyticum TaxID=2485123 RepID=A0A444JNS1_9GAMM|nr:helix-turn-helix transcriptional regulator [Photobacterium chitinilyticum]RWX54628.1 XRE family transcriptional regulator [Photobacterium chitinilyticum]